MCKQITPFGNTVIDEWVMIKRFVLDVWGRWAGITIVTKPSRILCNTMRCSCKCALPCSPCIDHHACGMLCHQLSVIGKWWSVIEW